MKDVELKRLDDVSINRKSDDIVSNDDASSADRSSEIAQVQFVPLLPTESGRKRHEAHQLKAPRFSQNVIEHQQSQYTEMYLG